MSLTHPANPGRSFRRAGQTDAREGVRMNARSERSQRCGKFPSSTTCKSDSRARARFLIHAVLFPARPLARVCVDAALFPARPSPLPRLLANLPPRIINLITRLSDNDPLPIVPRFFSRYCPRQERGRKNGFGRRGDR